MRLGVAATRGIVVAVMLVAVVAVEWSAAGAQDEPPIVTSTLVYTPTEAGPGTILAVSGENCGWGPVPAQFSDVHLERPDLSQSLGVSQRYSVRLDGTWSGEFLVPAWLAPGAYLINQICSTGDASPPNGPFQPFSVLDRPPPVVSIEPASVLAGAAVTVQGINCVNTTGPLVTAVITLYSATDAIVIETTTPIAPNGSFTATLSTPADAAAGDYSIAARCVGAGPWLQTDPAALALTTPTPPPSPPRIEPVVATPAFTG